jgi:hypothetical protein
MRCDVCMGKRWSGDRVEYDKEWVRAMDLRGRGEPDQM